MNRRVLFLLALCLPAAAAATGRVDTILAQQRAVGWRSPTEAIQRLEAADDRPGPDAPPQLARRYHAAIASYVVMTRQASLLEKGKASLAALETLAASGRCPQCMGEALVIRAQWDLTLRQLDDADALIHRAQAIAPAGDDHLQMQLHYARARLQNMRGNLSGAITESVAAAEAAERDGDTTGALMIRNLMVSINAALGDFAHAESIGNATYEQASRLHFAQMMASSKLNLGFLYVRSKQPARQIAALTEALRIAKDQPGLEEVQAISLSNIADYWLNAEDYRKALAYAREAEALARRIDDSRSLSYALTNEGVALAHLGDVEGGIALIHKAMAIADGLRALSDKVSMAGELINVYKLAGRYREALDATEQVSELQRAITQQEREKAVLEVQEKYASETRQREIERLTASGRIKQAELEVRTWQQRLFATLAVLLGLAAIPMVRWLGRARLVNRKLSGDIAVLEEQSLFDPLTGVSNRRHCQVFMAQHAAQAGTDAAPMGVMMLDVDFFKRVNDTHGHAVGDSVLVELARRLRALVRQHDAVVRWGGEEFALLLPGTTPEGLTVLAGRVLETIAGQPIHVGGRALPLTVSIGATLCPLGAGSSWEAAMQVADLALYMSKGAGRNRATCVVAVAAGADVDALANLDAAMAAGQVTLATVVGPTPSRTGASLTLVNG